MVSFFFNLHDKYSILSNLAGECPVYRFHCEYDCAPETKRKLCKEDPLCCTKDKQCAPYQKCCTPSCGCNNLCTNVTNVQN